MASVKRYIAKVGINFDGLKDKPRVEAGQQIPITVSDATIKDLLKDGIIEEVKEKKGK